MSYREKRSGTVGQVENNISNLVDSETTEVGMIHKIGIEKLP